MTPRISPLDNVSVAAPCTADWNRMVGNEQVRFCGQCSLNVYNLSGMTRVEAETLIRQSEGRLCVRFYQRTDGTILTKNCPVGLQAIKRRVSKMVNAVAATLLGFVAGVGFYLGFSEIQPNSPKTIEVMGTPRPIPIYNPQERPVMGEMAIPPQNLPQPTISRPLPVMGRMKVDPAYPLQPKPTCNGDAIDSGKNNQANQTKK